MIAKDLKSKHYYYSTLQFLAKQAFCTFYQSFETLSIN